MKWKLQPQEKENQKYFFNGKCLITQGAQELLSQEEALQIIGLLQKIAKEKNGIDYLQCFKNESGERIWIIDQLDTNMKKEHPSEHDYFTFLLPSEY